MAIERHTVYWEVTKNPMVEHFGMVQKRASRVFVSKLQ